MGPKGFTCCKYWQLIARGSLTDNMEGRGLTGPEDVRMVRVSTVHCPLSRSGQVSELMEVKQ